MYVALLRPQESTYSGFSVHLLSTERQKEKKLILLGKGYNSIVV